MSAALTLELTKGMCLGLVNGRDGVPAATADDFAVVAAIHVVCGVGEVKRVVVRVVEVKGM